MKRTAAAHWQGNLKAGKGDLTTASKTLSTTPFSFHSRFEEGAGTNPEELLAAAHAGCFTMALSNFLEQAGLTADSLDTICTITMEPKDGVPTVIGSHLELTAKIPGATKEQFEAAARAAEKGCPVSRLYNTAITLSMTLVS